MEWMADVKDLDSVNWLPADRGLIEAIKMYMRK